MKKLLLFPALVCFSLSAMAQVTLTGTSYTQNFNGIGGGLPTGWRLYAASTSTGLGDLKSLASSATTGIFRDTACGANNVTSGGYKNYASANVCTEGTPCATQQAATDRALGVRQVSKTNATNPNLDSGAAFVLVLANTTGLTNFNMSFKLQSLDTSCPRTTKWLVDYAIGTPTSFTAATTVPASLVTGNNLFSNTNVTVNFGTALDNKSSNVYIRIVTLEVSTGSGNRASTAIDDVNLTWTGGSSSSVAETAVQSTNLTQVGIGNSSSVQLAYTASEAGNYALNLFDMTGRKIHSENVTAKSGENTATVNANLTPGMYIAKITNGLTSGVVKVIVQ